MLHLGNLDALRDWGHARDYVEMQWLMLQQDKPDDFVIASGRQHSVREFVEIAAAELGMEIRWEGRGLEERGVVAAVDRTRCECVHVGQVVVGVDPAFFRPAEVETLLGDASKARDCLGWKPRTEFCDMVREMVAHDLAQARRARLLKSQG
jgi:GDPmannose 4,6-dehydratase